LRSVQESLAMNEPGQRGHVTEQARGKCNLSAVVFLMADAVVHPGQSPSVLPVELPDRLQKQRFASGPNPLFPVSMRTFEQGDET
jgi:hypothetical protein